MGDEYLFRIIINTKDYNWTKGSISYEDIVKLTGMTQGIIYTVTYQYTIGLHQKVNGSLVPGQAIDIKHDMIINIVLTNNG